jgi:phytoene dehydrogenase-like protein
MADYDCIVIGSGHNGLICALYLARAGWRVLVLEQQSSIGGAAQTSELTLPGFKHDLYATNFTSFLASPAYADFGSSFSALGVRFIAAEHCYASAYADSVARVYRDPDATEAEIARHTLRDLDGWRDVVRLFTTSASRFLPLHFTRLGSRQMMGHVARIATGPIGDTIDLARILIASSRQFVDRYFASEAVKGLFTPWAFHLDYGPDIRGGATFAFVAAISAYLRGLNLVEGGAGELMQALRLMIEKHGGQVMTGSPVSQIVVSNGAARGVRLADNREISAAKAIVANVAPGRLFGELVARDELPSAFFRRMSGFRHAVGTFVLHLALSDRLQWLGAEDLSAFAYVHLNGASEDISATYAQALAGHIPSRPMLIVSQATAIDPSRAPAGRQIVRVHARAFPTRILGDASQSIEERDWDRIKEAVADRLIDLLAEQAPNVRSALLQRAAVSPADLERANPNLVGGDCNGGSHHLNQYYFMRPAVGWTSYRTPIRNLHMIGASQWPGSGVNGASGYLLARQLIN